MTVSWSNSGMDVHSKKQSIFQMQAYSWKSRVVRATGELGSPQVNGETVWGPDDTADTSEYSQTNKSASMASGNLCVDRRSVWDSAYKCTLLLSKWPEEVHSHIGLYGQFGFALLLILWCLASDVLQSDTLACFVGLHIVCVYALVRQRKERLFTGHFTACTPYIQCAVILFTDGLNTHTFDLSCIIPLWQWCILTFHQTAVHQSCSLACRDNTNLLASQLAFWNLALKHGVRVGGLQYCCQGLLVTTEHTFLKVLWASSWHCWQNLSSAKCYDAYHVKWEWVWYSRYKNV